MLMQMEKMLQSDFSTKLHWVMHRPTSAYICSVASNELLALAMANPENDSTYSEAETVARREAALKRMLNTPHQKHKPLGKRKPE